MQLTLPSFWATLAPFQLFEVNLNHQELHLLSCCATTYFPSFSPSSTCWYCFGNQIFSTAQPSAQLNAPCCFHWKALNSTGRVAIPFVYNHSRTNCSQLKTILSCKFVLWLDITRVAMFFGFFFPQCWFFSPVLLMYPSVKLLEPFVVEVWEGKDFTSVGSCTLAICLAVCWLRRQGTEQMKN